MGLDPNFWKPVIGYENRYLVSKDGQIYSNYIKRIMKFNITKDGYYSIKLKDDNKYTHHMVHRLVAEAFIKKPDNILEYEVDHIDNNRQNNNISNLRWVTHKENLDKSFELGNQNKLKRKVIQYTLKGEKINVYESVNEAFRQTNVRHISECALGKRNTAGGYIWKYE